MLSFVAVKLQELRVDETYQRPIAIHRVDCIVKQFKPEVCGSLVVSRRKSGELYIVDGRHRFEALKRLKKSEWPSQVLEGLSVEDEASLFDAFNIQRKNATTSERFRVRLRVGEATAVAINKAVESAGFKLATNRASSSKKAKSTVYCVGALLHAHKSAPTRALDVITRGLTNLSLSYVDEQLEVATRGDFLKGLLLFMGHERWHKKIDDSRLRIALGKRHPQQMLRSAAARARSEGGSLYTHLIDVLRELYNSKLSKRNRLPPRQEMEE